MSKIHNNLENFRVQTDRLLTRESAVDNVRETPCSEAGRKIISAASAVVSAVAVGAISLSNRCFGFFSNNRSGNPVAHSSKVNNLNNVNKSFEVSQDVSEVASTINSINSVRYRDGR